MWSNYRAAHYFATEHRAHLLEHGVDLTRDHTEGGLEHTEGGLEGRSAIPVMSAFKMPETIDDGGVADSLRQPLDGEEPECAVGEIRAPSRLPVASR